MIALAINQLSLTLNKKSLLKNINLVVEKGTICGIVGRNGSGKSLLFKVIAGLIASSEGSVQVQGKTIKNGAIPENFGMLLDKPGFLPQYSGLKNLKLLASIKHLIDEGEIKEAIEKVGLALDDTTPVKKYSLGMKQRLGIAQAIMEKPTFIILDEPMNGLDEEGVTEIRQLLLELRAKGATILISSHNNEDINILCDDVYKMDKGDLQKQS